MKRAPRHRRLLRILLLSGMLATALCLTGFHLFRQSVNRPWGTPGTVTVDIPPGTSVKGIAQRLQSEGIISSAVLFRVHHALQRPRPPLKSGEYAFQLPMRMDTVYRLLQEGRVVLHRLTLTEGLNIWESIDEMHRQLQIPRSELEQAVRNTGRIRDLDPKAEDLEGYLFPDTYQVARSMNASAIVDMLVEHFREHFTDTFRWKARELGLSIREAVTLASLIEKETALREERFLISSVFHNRLKTGMSLGCDPTVIYALLRDGLWQGKLGWKDLKYPSPYNTRVSRGLPPGPICSPGMASLEAALNPESSEYLCFVAKDNRSHHFSRTLNEHNRAVKKFIIDRPDRSGKAISP